MALHRMQSLLASFPPETGEWIRHTYWGDEKPDASFWDQFFLQGLFATYRCLLIIEAEKWNQAVWKKLDETLPHMSETVWPFFLLTVPWQSGKPKIPASIAKTKTYILADQKGWVWRNMGLTEQNISSYLFSRARERGTSLPDTLLRSLVPLLPPEAAAIENELDKLEILLRAEQEKKQPGGNALDVLSSYDQEFNPFLCIRHIEEGNLEKVFGDIAGQKDHSKLFFTLQVLLERDFRALWQLKTNQSASIAPSIQAKKKEQARRTPFALLARAMTTLVETEWAIKNGTMDVATAFDTMLITLTALFAGKERL
ncbi:MAG: DNA polymerase III subunit delta [Desulfovibrio sp.]|nr:DNA polymerase III subunit delta [Desulfovibrio sp.]